jgi:mannose-1-phosphate guanylyltransferase
MDNNNYCIIMAGGIGSRFWPMSKTSKPKQFLDILGTGKTLLQQTFERFLPFCPSENIYIVTSSDYKNHVLDQIKGIKSEQILLEPTRRNTAPCIAYATYKIGKNNPNARFIVAPSDHLILNISEFNTEISKGLEFVSKNNSLLTLGIKPSRPETGYGYIQINSGKKKLPFDNLKKVKTFTEKPNLELANVFVQSGEFYWNSGIFIWSYKAIQEAFETHLPEVNSLFKEGLDVYNTTKEKAFIQHTYSECRNISIDYGVMEKADNVYVLCTDFGWSDLGTWGSLYENREKDKNGNVITGRNIFLYNSKNSIVHLPDKKVVVINGMNDFIIVESDNMLLICKKEEEQQIRQFVNEIKIQKGEQYI